MTQFKEKTLAQMVTEDHRRAAIFEKYNLDFCCKGKRSLQQACDELDLPVEQITDELNFEKDSFRVPINFGVMSMSQLVDHIVSTHHAYTKKELPQIISYLQRVATKHGHHHPEMVEVFTLFSLLKEDMEQHMKKEEEDLFPLIKNLDEANTNHRGKSADINRLRALLDTLEAEHDLAGELLQKIRSLTDNYFVPPDACTTFQLSLAALRAFEIDLHKHVHLENNILFPKALQAENSLLPEGASLA